MTTDKNAVVPAALDPRQEPGSVYTIDKPAKPARVSRGVKAGDGSVRVRKVAKPAAEKPAAKKRETRQDARNAVRKAVANATKGKAARKTKSADAAPTGEKLTVRDRIWAMIRRDQGVTEREVCDALGWKKAGATIGRAIKAAPFAVKKERDGARVRYYAA